MGTWALERPEIRSLPDWLGIMVVALGAVVVLVRGPPLPLFYFVLGTALVVIGIVLFRHSRREDADDE